jgi:hypothetical protein
LHHQTSPTFELLFAPISGRNHPIRSRKRNEKQQTAEESRFCLNDCGCRSRLSLNFQTAVVIGLD